MSDDYFNYKYNLDAFRAKAAGWKLGKLKTERRRIREYLNERGHRLRVDDMQHMERLTTIIDFYIRCRRGMDFSTDQDLQKDFTEWERKQYYKKRWH